MDVKEILKDIPISEVAERLGLELPYLKGHSLQGHCPTGHESQGGKCFSVNTRDGFYYCFSCGIGGDVISLVELARGVNFTEALKWLAEQFQPGLLPEIERGREEPSPEQRERYEKAALLDLLYQHGRELLYREQGKEALTYLVEVRGYDPEVLKKTEWIYWPRETEIRAYLKQAQPETAREAIDKLKLTGYYGDRFRLAFPYRDRRGTITGYIKRASRAKGYEIEGQRVRWDSTPGTVKKDLFNLSHCKDQEELLLVEGYPDTLYLQALGFNGAVAVGQGRLSADHLEGLRAFRVKRVVISFDNDKVGPDNTEAAAELLLKGGIRPFIIDPLSLGEYKDPDELIRAEGLDRLKELIRTAERGTLWLARRIAGRHDVETDLGKEQAFNSLLAFEDSLKDPRDTDTVLEVIEDHLGYSREEIEPLILDYREKQARERGLKAGQELLRQAQGKLSAGDLNGFKALMSNKYQALRAQGVDWPAEAYGVGDLIRDIQRSREGLRTGYYSLDKAVSVPQSALTIIAGRPSHGKTTLILNLLLNMTKEYSDQAFFLFSYEESRRQIGLKLLNIIAGEEITKLQNLYSLERYLREDRADREAIEEGKLELDRLTRQEGRLWLTDEPLYINELVDRLAYLAERYPIGAVLIDYIQKIKTRERYSTRQLELQAISGQLLEAAVSFGIPIITGAQLGRDKTTSNEKKRVRLDNLRESGDIEQDASLVLGLYNEAMEKAQDEGKTLRDPEVSLLITLLKNRAGPVNESVKLTFNRPVLRITDPGGTDSRYSEIG